MTVCPQCRHDARDNARICSWCGFIFKNNKTANHERLIYPGSEYFRKNLSEPAAQKLPRFPVTAIISNAQAHPTNTPAAVIDSIADSAKNQKIASDSANTVFSEVTDYKQQDDTPGAYESIPFQISYSAKIASATRTYVAPPPLPAYTQISRGSASWLWSLLLFPVILLLNLHSALQGEIYWASVSGAIASAGFLTLAVMCIWITALWVGAGKRPRLILASTALTVLAAASVVFANIGPALSSMQAGQMEQNGQFAQAAALYGENSDTAGAARVYLEWGSQLVEKGQFAQAAVYLNKALAMSSGYPKQQALEELGQLYWQSGNAALNNKDISGATLAFQNAVKIAPGSAGAEMAQQALSAPQTVSGVMQFLNLPLPGLQVALVSQWSYDPTLQLLQTGGQRLQAVTGADGSFTVSGAAPGVTYALVWQGANGDTTNIGADGSVQVTITIQPLQGAQLGVITIQTGPRSPSAGAQ